MPSKAASQSSANQFNTFAGVFTPCTLTILGVIMFLRFGEVVGNAGILHAVLIVIGAKLITSLTAFSLSAIATNTPVKGGGAYFMISRTLGIAPGGAIGLVLYLAQSMSVAMYVIGFTEAFVATFPDLPGSFRLIASAVNLFTFLCVFIGAGWTIKLQYGILAILAASLVSFSVGALSIWSPETFQANLNPMYSETTNPLIIFALFFPAVTGIMAGANMSGDLKDPAKAIPHGTLWAIGVTGFIYISLALLLGGIGDAARLRTDPMIMQKVSVVPLLVTLGIFSATMSSALGSMMGAPRILQALGKDRVFAPIRHFAKGSGINREPRRAIVFTALLSQAAILLGDLNAIAPIITMFFIITYGMINWSCFAEMHSKNPSFRPKFRISHEFIPLAGALGCLGVMFLVNITWAFLAFVIMGLIYSYLQREDLETRWGDVNSGFAFERAKRILLSLNDVKSHPKNWRPSLMVFTGNPQRRLQLAQMGTWLTDTGLLTLSQVAVQEGSESSSNQIRMERELLRFIRDNRLSAFPAVVSSSSFLDGAKNLIQCHGIGTLRPNTVMVGWSDETERQEDFARIIRMIAHLKRSVLVVNAREDLLDTTQRPEGTIDVWWRGQSHGALMLLLAHLLSQTQDWGHRPIRLLRCTSTPSEMESARLKLEKLIKDARITAEPRVVLTDQFDHALKRESKDAALVFLGFHVPEPGTERAFMERFRSLMTDMPSFILVNSEGSARLEA
jgi:amino acid transporter